MATASDNFNRADSASLGANWTLAGGSPFNHLSIASNTCASPQGAQFGADFWSNDTFSSSQQFSKATVTALNDQWGVAIFMSGSLAWYGAGHDNARSGNFHRRIWKWVGGSYTSLTSDSTDLAVNDVVEIRSDGAGNILMFVNTVQVLSVSDSDNTTGQPGLEVRQVSTNPTTAYDDWSGGDVSGGGGGSTIGIRKTLSQVGTAAGKRQTHRG